MQKLMKAIENMMVAITFAEAGEYDEANRLSLQDPRDEQCVAEPLRADQA